MEDIDYGCFCRNLTRMAVYNFDSDGSISPSRNGNNRIINFKNFIGHPVDYVDGLCKYMINGWACLKSQNVELTLNYVSPGYMATSVDQAIILCDQVNQGNVHAANLCKIEEQFAFGIVQ